MSKEGKAIVLNESELKCVIKVLSTNKHTKRNTARLFICQINIRNAYR